MVSTYSPLGDLEATLTPAYVVNHPDPSVPYTRTVESKHATGQRIQATVVSREYPGSQARHYPLPTVDSRFQAVNDELKREIVRAFPIPVAFCGRLANYQYINQDEAVAQGFAAAEEIHLTLTDPS